MKKIGAACALVTALATANPAHAATFYCAGRVLAIGQFDEGSVTVQIENLGDSFYICQTDGAFSSVSAETCRVWLSQLLSAYALGKTVRVYFDTARPENANMSTSCQASDFGWNWRLPWFLQVQP